MSDVATSIFEVPSIVATTLTSSVLTNVHCDAGERCFCHRRDSSRPNKSQTINSSAGMTKSDLNAGQVINVVVWISDVRQPRIVSDTQERTVFLAVSCFLKSF